MPEISNASCDCKVFETFEEAQQHGRGAIFYKWLDGNEKTFPDNVEYLRIFMPVTYGEAYPGCIESMKNDVVDIIWHTNNFNWTTDYKLPQWTLSGTQDKPTLSPSLNWIGYWHGFLRDGRLQSC